jgi:hypothetical protein
MMGASLKLVGSAIFVLTAATASLAQNTSNPALSGNTVNPQLSGNTVTPGLVLPGLRQLPVSPAPPTGLVNTPAGTNPFTGAPCTGAASTQTSAPFTSIYGPPPASC